MRWARAIRDSRKLDYLGLAATFGLPWALITVIFARAALWSWLPLALTLALRFALATVTARQVLRQRLWLGDYLLLPLRDIAALFIWVASFFGSTIHWRGLKFRLKQGKLYAP
jgi:ceramide glucosyltransferase